MRLILSRTCLWLLLLFASPISLLPITAHAQVIADSPCDNAYYESLSARAWLEAQREITQNQNIILKPDSVLEYTCFDQLVWELGDHAVQMLSETAAYGNPLGPASMDNALDRLVMNAIGSYFNSNYGGVSIGTLGGHPTATAIRHTVPPSLHGTVPLPNGTSPSSSAYSCNIMKRVWQAAKCINFITDASFDGFYTFGEYAISPDKRRLPVTCSVLPLGNWGVNLTAALTSGPWTNDPVQTYLTETNPQNCTGATCPCSGDPIPTGVKVSGQSPGPASYDEKICLQPACRYHPGGFPLIPGGTSDDAEGCYGR